MQLAHLHGRHRESVTQLLHATAAFTDEEIAVALELFDTVHGEPTTRHHERWPTADASATAIAIHVDYEFIGAFDQNESLLGYACFGPSPGTEGTFDLYWLAVEPTEQGRGTGKALVIWVERELIARGARMLVVETSSLPKYARTRDFYARLGFVDAARVRDFYAPADDRIILTRRLTTRDGGVTTR